MRPTSREAVLELKNLRLKYPNGKEWVISSASLEVGKGEFCLVLGETGSGKTSLARAITGVAWAIYGCEVRGEIRILGRKITEYGLDELRRVVQVVNQNPYTHFTDTILKEDLLGHAESLYDTHYAWRVVERLSESFGIKELLAKPIYELSGGQIKRAAIVKALIGNPVLLILDEPLMWLDSTGLSEVLEALARVKRTGRALLVLEHRFLPLLGLADKVVLLSGGRLKRVDINECLEHAEEHIAPKSETNTFRHRQHSNSTSLSRAVMLKNVWFKYDREWVLKGASLTAEEGKTYVVYGENGTGKSTLLKVVAGYLKPVRGYVVRQGKPIYIPQVPYLFFTEESIKAEVEKLCKANRLGPNCTSRGLKVLERYGYRPEDVPFSLSWGQMLRLAVLTSTLIGGFNLVLVDEPFSGLTYSGRMELARLLSEVPATKIITTSSTDMLELFEDAIIMRLENGRLTGFRQALQARGYTRLSYQISRALYGDPHC